jgi:NAD(P)-dependent dehydrogenase (short-subunit alcohol dehydrogenase family)
VPVDALGWKTSGMELSTWGFEAGAVVVVTGAGSGIGRATALRCAEVGLAVGAWDLDESSAKSTVTEIVASGGRAVALGLDVSDRAAVDAAFATTVTTLGRVQHLVNNAGPRAADPIAFRDGLALAAGIVATVTESFLALEPTPGASIVNVASVAGTIVAAEPIWYASAKAAITGYTRSLAVSIGRTVRVNAVGPSLVNTPRMTKWTESEQGQHWAEINPLGRWAVADDIAGPILFLLSPLAAYVNGVLLPIDGGQTLVL